MQLHIWKWFLLGLAESHGFCNCQPLQLYYVSHYIWGLWRMYVTILLSVLPILHISTMTPSSVTVIAVIMWGVWNNQSDKEQYILEVGDLWMYSGGVGKWERVKKKVVRGRKKRMVSNKGDLKIYGRTEDCWRAQVECKHAFSCLAPYDLSASRTKAKLGK